MADYGTNAANDLCNELIIMLTQYGIDLEAAKIELYRIMHDYHVERKSTDIVPYEGNVNTDLMKKFLAVKTVKGCSRKTISMYQQSVWLVLGKIGKPAPQITVDDIRWYIARRMKEGVSVVTCNNELRCLSSFFTWMQDDEIVTKNPVIKNGKIKAPKTKKFAFDEEEIERMRMTLSTWREKTIFEMLLSTGCRVSELVSIRIKDVKNDEVNIVGKGNKMRTVYINARARLAMESYLAERSDDNPFLLPSKKRDNLTLGDFMHAMGTHGLKRWYTNKDLVDDILPMETSSVEQMIRTIGRKAGVENAHPHRFRRTCATYALRRGMTLELVSKMLGHESVATTQIYLDLNEDDLKLAHRKYVT